MENPDTKCGPLSFTQASVNVTCWHAWHKVCKRASKGKWKLAMNANTIRGTVTDMAKGQNLTHTGFHWGSDCFRKRHTHTEKPLLQFETPPTEHVTLLLLTAGSYSLMSFLTANLLSNCFFFSFFFISLSVSPVYLPVIWSPLKGCFSSLSPLAISALKGSLQLEGKQTQQRIFQLNCQKLAVLINPAQWKGREPFVKWPHPWRSAWVLPGEPCLPEPASPR